jgi:Tfp pilus assembly protein PilF
MEPAPEYAPKQHEVETQLARMLENDEFSSSPRLSELLRYIVTATLPDKEGKTDPVMLTEYQIGFKVFKETYDSKGSAVRVNATYLRDRLRKYYANSGSRDRVRIEVPPGGYRAEFSYNRSSPAGKLYQRACSLIAGFVPSEHEHSSLGLFRKAIELDPDYAPAHAALAEAELIEAMYRRSIPPHNPVAAAGSSALKALRLERRLWRAQVALAAVRCCRRQWDRADRSFDKAVALAPNAKRDHPWYAGFLLAIGGRRQEMEALRLARARAEAKPEDASAQVALGFFLYLVRQFDQADEFLCETIARFPQSLLARIVLACVHLAKDNAVEALVIIEQAHAIQDEHVPRGSFRDNVFPGLYHLCSLRYYGESNIHRSRESIEKAVGLDRTAVYEVRHDAGEIPGEPGDYEGWDPGHFDTYIPYWTPLQLALGLMALEEKEAAIAALTRAVREGDPLTVFLRRLPLFDEIRGDAAFKSLIDGMNFPK